MVCQYSLYIYSGEGAIPYLVNNVFFSLLVVVLLLLKMRMILKYAKLKEQRTRKTRSNMTLVGIHV